MDGKRGIEICGGGVVGWVVRGELGMVEKGLIWEGFVVCRYVL